MHYWVGKHKKIEFHDPTKPIKLEKKEHSPNRYITNFEIKTVLRTPTSKMVQTKIYSECRKTTDLHSTLLKLLKQEKA